MGLRQNNSGHQSKWTEKEILAGFIEYKNNFGHFPSAGQIDAYEFLPSARSIQRTHGGLIALRKRLFPELTDEHNLTKGVKRANKAREADNRAKKYEEEFYLFLCSHFTQIAIHEQKRIRPGDVSSDFYIYLNSTSGVVIDLFYAQDIKTMSKIINIKLKRYIGLATHRVLFVLVGNDAISQSKINFVIKNKKTVLPENIKIVSEKYFKDSEIIKLKLDSDYSQE